MFVHEIAGFFSPWNSLYSDSKAVSTAVTAMHILELLFGGGLALAADRSTLRALKRPETERQTQLRELSAVHRPVLIALTVMFLSGAAMAAADVQTFATSPFFWVKMGLVALLLANGYYLTRVEQGLKATALVPVPAEGATATPPAPATRLWRSLRRASLTSLTLWTLTALAGAVLTGAS